MSVFISDIDKAELYVQFLDQNNPNLNIRTTSECVVSSKC